MSTIKKIIDYKVEKLVLYAGGMPDPIDLLPNMVEINYFEDIFNNTVSGNVVLNDSVGILNFGSVNGTEYLHLRFKKSDDFDFVFDRKFRVVAVNDRQFDIANNNENYRIEFCSEEYILSEQYRISKSYKGRKISNIVSDICTNYLKTNKNLYIDDTLGVYDFVLPNKKLLETINWLANYAIPTKYPHGADIVFFENRIGYFFTSLQHLFSTDSTTRFQYNPKNITNDIAYNLTNIMSFEVVRYVDTLQSMNKGLYANRLISLDVLGRKKTTTDYNYNDYYKKSLTLNGSPVTNNYKNRLNKFLFDSPPSDLDAGALRMVVSNANQRNSGEYTKDNPAALSADYNIEKSLPFRVAQLELSRHTTLKITIPGYVGLVCGTCVDINILSPQALNKKGPRRPIDPYLSGKYLITAIRHIITPASYICVAEVCKDSNAMNYSGVSEADSAWSGLVSGTQNNRNK